MKKIIAAFFILFIIVSPSCKKEDDIKPAIAGKLLQVVQMWEKDIIFYITPIPYPTNLKIESDRSWTLNVSGNIAKGTLTWEPIDAESAHVKFYVSDWNIPDTDEVQKKLRRIVESVNKCEYRATFSPEIHFTINSAGADNSFFYAKEL